MKTFFDRCYPSISLSIVAVSKPLYCFKSDTDLLFICCDVQVYENVDKMAQFGFENDIHSILKLDMPITNAPMARWQRKASSSNTSALSGLSPGKSANVSLSSSKTPSKTPGSVFVCIYTRMSGKALQMLTTGKFFFCFFF